MVGVNGDACTGFKIVYHHSANSRSTSKDFQSVRARRHRAIKHDKVCVWIVCIRGVDRYLIGYFWQFRGRLDRMSAGAWDLKDDLVGHSDAAV